MGAPTCAWKSAPVPRVMAKAMKAMKAMKAKKVGGGGGFAATLAAKTGQKPKDVRALLNALKEVAAKDVAKGKFVIPQVVMLKLKHKPARPAGKRMMFGKEVKVAAMKASKVVKAFAAKAIKNSI